MLFFAFLLWLSSMEPCDARRGRHWRHKRHTLPSLAKKKGKVHGSSHHYQKGGSKPKTPPPPHKTQPPPQKAPSPPYKAPSPVPKPIKNAPPSPAPPRKGYRSNQPSVFNVIDFGAKGDGVADDTKAFEAAWAAACKVEASMMIVPDTFTFLVGPVAFSGPCNFHLDGTIIAPIDSKPWGKGLFQWLLFAKLRGITVQGKGIIDGRGSGWWQDSPLEEPMDNEMKLIIPLNSTLAERPPMPVRSELSGKMPSLKPTALRFYGSFNVTVTGITIQNSPQCHLKFDNCMGVVVHDMSVSSPGDSPNTDGIHLQNSKDVLIRGTNLACGTSGGRINKMICAGDDCISIQTGCSNVFVHNVNCGPGHGISIGGLGKDNTKACVSNITVRDIMMHNTMTGVRIKSWQVTVPDESEDQSSSVLLL